MRVDDVSRAEPRPGRHYEIIGIYFHHCAGHLPWHLPSAAELPVSVSQSYLF
jgi:hypothetical protein